MTTVKETLDRILDLTSDVVESQKGLIVIKLVENSTKVASQSIFGAVSLVLIAIILVFLGLGLVWWIGESLNDIKAGFFIVGGAFILLLLTLMLLGKRVILPSIRNILIRKIYED